MTWTGAVTTFCLWVFALIVTGMIWRKRRSYRLNTKAIFSVYVAYLLLQGCTTFLDQVWLTITLSVLRLLLLPYFIIFFIRIMRVGDPFQVMEIVEDLRNQVRKRARVKTDMIYSNPTEAEQASLKIKANELELRMEQIHDRLDSALKLNGKGNDA